MRRESLNYVVDALALAAMLALAATGATLKWVLPPGSRGGHGLSLWGLTRHEWGDIHFWIAVALAVLILLHVALHWTWVCAVTPRLLRPRRAGPIPNARRRNLAGAAFLLLLAAALVGFLWLTSTAVTRGPDDDHEGGGRRRRAGRAQVERRSCPWGALEPAAAIVPAGPGAMIDGC